MSEQLGKIEKPQAEDFKQGRKLFLVPLIYSVTGLESEYLERFERYWQQVGEQLRDLESKLGRADRMYHELVVSDGEKGAEAIKALNEKSHGIVKDRMDRGAQLDAIEETELLTEFMDWGRCLAVGLKNQKVLTQVYESYSSAGAKRNECITKQIDETLKANETGILLIREGHQVQFPPDIRVFYVAPPALDEIKRWIRDQQPKPQEDNEESQEKKEGST